NHGPEAAAACGLFQKQPQQSKSNEVTAAASRGMSREAFPVESSDALGASPPVVTSSTSASASTQLASGTLPHDEERRETVRGPTEHDATETAAPAAASAMTGVATPKAALRIAERIVECTESHQKPVAAAENGQATT
ncbi:hypothetical protein EWM64_g6865, partial [Hericium alpestre]